MARTYSPTVETTATDGRYPLLDPIQDSVDKATDASITKEVTAKEIDKAGAGTGYAKPQGLLTDIDEPAVAEQDGMDIGDMPAPDIPPAEEGGAPRATSPEMDEVYQGDEGIFDQVARDVSDIQPTTREVQDEELTSYQLDQLMKSDSKYMQDARRQGLEASNAMGGLGGTAGVGASMTAALRAGLPIAQQDALAFQKAATENQQALNQFAQLSLQRATQLELGHLDARVRMDITKMANSMQMAVSKLQTDAQIEVANLDAATKIRVQEMNGALQERLAGLQYKYNTLLNDQQNAAKMMQIDQQGEYNLLGEQIRGEYDLRGEQVRGEYSLEGYAMQQELQEETNYVNMVADANKQYWNMLTMYEGQDLDANAMARVRAQAEAYYEGQIALINKMFPDQEPIDLVAPDNPNMPAYQPPKKKKKGKK